MSTPTHGVAPNTGPLATAAWLLMRGFTSPPPRWHAEITLSTPVSQDDDVQTLLRLELFSEEWGFWFRHAGKVSWIRVTDLPFVHGRDEHELLAATPALRNFETLVAALEARFDVRFDIDSAVIRTSLADGEQAIRSWIRGWLP